VSVYRRIRVRRGTSNDWQTSNVALDQGEIGMDLTAKRMKVGDGFTSWNDLPYIDDAGLDQIRAEYGDEVTFGLNFDLNK
tara:strand:- start:664 stop:903 length:240 start_codon:yes stop_codon:yes gene_type:complete